VTDAATRTCHHRDLIFESHTVRDHIIKKLRFETACRTD
jgi:hypothetical protein